MHEADLDALTGPARSLQVVARERRWTHLSLCVLDAVFSIGAHYSGVTRVCHAYADHAALPDRLLPVGRAREVVGTGLEQPLDALLELGERIGPDRLAAEVLAHRGRTSPRGGVLKAHAALEYARTLTGHGVMRLDDATDLLTDDDRFKLVRDGLARIPGHGSGARLSYLWMLVGDERRVKPDRMVLGWLTHHLGRPVDAGQAQVLLVALADRVGRTPWELDHAIWRHRPTTARSRRKTACRDDAGPPPTPPAPTG
ncbi:hypothetical protein [Actinosynnema pretiosum]|uniref:Uncharacterized protein n=1 Tax=Actinosynnema pretiosum TaxID=42197 RepID=A0A290Z9T3_9PSEU|nr:hypothetical protein [Actinosynnema pretiosum]ATE55745.1 hypothetical protein CNX65_22675 [Actinosynnema pretiosum]